MADFPSPESELFWWACYSNALAVLPDLLKATPPLNLSAPHPTSGVTPLCIAISRHSNDVVDLLLVTERDRMHDSACQQSPTLTGSTALGTSVLSGNLPAAKLLLQRYGRDALGTVPYSHSHSHHHQQQQQQQQQQQHQQKGRHPPPAAATPLLPGADVNGVDAVTLGRSLGPSQRSVSEYIYGWLRENSRLDIPPFLLPHDEAKAVNPEDLLWHCATCGKSNDGEQTKCAVCGRSRLKTSSKGGDTDASKGVLPPLLPEVKASPTNKRRTSEHAKGGGGGGVKFM